MAHLPSFTRCKICASEHRDRIDSMIAVGGASNRVVGKKFGFSKDQIQRHTRHLEPARRAALLVGPARVAQLATAAVDESRSLLDYLSITRSVVFNQLLCAAEAGDTNGVGITAGRVLDVLRELGKLTGELRQISGLTINQTNNTLNLVASPEFGKLAAGLLKIARANPVVRPDIVALLKSLEDEEAAVTNHNGRTSAPVLIEGSAIQCEAVP
jgi:hypothetical protein